MLRLTFNNPLLSDTIIVTDLQQSVGLNDKDINKNIEWIDIEYLTDDWKYSHLDWSKIFIK